MKLHLGCGTNYLSGYLNVDIDPDVFTDWCGDCNNMPYPDDTFDHIFTSHSLEHFDDLFTIINEMARVSKDGATWEIIVPYYTWPQHMGNPYHKLKYWNEHTFKFFDKENGIYKRGQKQPYSLQTLQMEWDEQQIKYYLKVKKPC